MEARYHVQVEILDRRDDGAARARVGRVFRGDGTLRAGDEIRFRVPVLRPGERPQSGGAAWTRRSRWRVTAYLEAFLNGTPPSCGIAAHSEYLRLSAEEYATGSPVFHDPSADEVAASWAAFQDGRPEPTPFFTAAASVPATDGAETDSDDDVAPTLSVSERGLVLTAEDLVAHVGGDPPDPSRASWRRLILPLDPYADVPADVFAQPPAPDPVAVLYRYEDPSRPLLVDAFVGLPPPPKPPKIHHGVMLTQLSGIYGASGLRLIDRSELWRWGEESGLSLILKGDTPVGNYLVARTTAAAFCFIFAGVHVDTSDTAAALLDPVTRRIERFVAGPGSSSPE